MMGHVTHRQVSVQRVDHNDYFRKLKTRPVLAPSSLGGTQRRMMKATEVALSLDTAGHLKSPHWKWDQDEWFQVFVLWVHWNPLLRASTVARRRQMSANADWFEDCLGLSLKCPETGGPSGVERGLMSLAAGAKWSSASSGMDPLTDWRRKDKMGC